MPGLRELAHLPVRVTVVLKDGHEEVLPAGSAIARSMGQVAALLAHG